MYWDDKYGTHSLSPDVQALLKLIYPAFVNFHQESLNYTLYPLPTFLIAGNIQHEGVDDRGFEQCCQYFFPAG